MTGVLLAGGNGTRLQPATYIYNKHLALVYDQPMIMYPLKTLINMGCTEILIVSTPSGVKSIKKLFKDFYNIKYFVQERAGGIAQALGCIPPMNGVFPVILGDNYFEDYFRMPKRATLYTKVVEDPERFGVYSNGKIIEKPDNPKSKNAVTGLYVYDGRVFDMIPKLKRSERGEFEITDINNQYLKLGANVVKLKGMWKDMGTPDSLLEVANHVRP